MSSNVTVNLTPADLKALPVSSRAGAAESLNTLIGKCIEETPNSWVVANYQVKLWTLAAWKTHQVSKAEAANSWMQVIDNYLAVLWYTDPHTAELDLHVELIAYT